MIKILVVTLFTVNICIAGQSLYENRCMSCHGQRGAKQEGDAPKIGGQHQFYLILMMERFKDSRVHSSIVLTNKERKSLANYIGSLKK